MLYRKCNVSLKTESCVKMGRRKTFHNKQCRIRKTTTLHSPFSLIIHKFAFNDFNLYVSNLKFFPSDGKGRTEGASAVALLTLSGEAVCSHEINQFEILHPSVLCCMAAQTFLANVSICPSNSKTGYCLSVHNTRLVFRNPD